MSCPACGRDNRPGARFCADCGAAQAARCHACQAELPAGARFCDVCGAGLAAPSAPAVGSQTRKVVTVVFADLAGSTSLQEHLDPESVRHLMDGFYRALRGAVAAHGGTTVKFTGDGLMAAFGVQAVAEDDAWRAVQAAAAMQLAFAQLGWDPSLALRVGVNTGEVIVTEGEADVVGDAVNVAARLESAADAGGVLVGEATWRVTRHLARFEAVPPLTLRGKAEPVPAYRLLGVADVVVDAGGPFVGREDELARLATLFDEVQQAGVVRLATVIGSPGLGKSRLAAELTGTLSDRATVLEARFSATSASTLAPIVEALRSALSDEAVGDVLSASPQTAFLAVRRAIETLAQARPVVLVLEDLHWAEPLALDLVEHLVEWTQDAPVLLLGLARPELREVRSSLVDTGARAAVVTVLEGLDPVASERLACDLLETNELPPALVARILEGSEGNPLFVRELVRMLVDDGVLQLHGQEWRPTIEVDAITVPPTIQSLLAARVERLATDERTVLECAAIVGREFYRGAVAALVPGTVRADLDRILERLRRKEMVEPDGTYWLDEPVLRFHHVLLRDAAYRRLLKEVRAELHERHAGWLEAKVGGGDDDEVLGYHLEQAHQYRTELGLFDEQTAILGHRAATRLATAGRRALDRDDLPAAAGLLGRALARTGGDDPERPGLLIDRCEALLSTGAVVDGGLAVAELETLADGSPRLRAWATCFAAQLAILTDPGHLRETAALVEHAAVELAKLADAAGAAKAHAVHASALARLGRVAETEAALDRALAAAREAGDTRRATGVLAGAPVAALWGPSPVARASGRCLDVVRVLRITSSATTVEATSLRCQAVLEALRGRTEAARRMLSSARRSLEELGHRHGLLSTDMFAGLVELLAEDAAAAEVALQRAHDGFLELGAGADAGQAAALLGRALLAQGRTEEAEALTAESERLGGADLKTAIAWRAVRAEALARRGLFDEALALAQAAVALAEPTDALLDQADTHLAMATVLQLAGRHDEAEASARRSAQLYERKGATVPAERAAALAGHAQERPAATAPSPLDGADGATSELVATRGQLFALYRGADELHLVETDPEGRLVLDLTFARDDLAAAIRELDARYVGSDPAFGQSWAAALAYIDSLNARAWDDFRAVFAPDFVAVDKRPAGFGTLDGEGMTEWAQGLVAMAPDNWLYAVEVPMISTDGHVALVVNRGTAKGSPFEMVRAVAAAVRGDRLTRIEFFEADDLDEARARFEELTTGTPMVDVIPPSTVLRTLARFAELHRLGWPQAEALVAADVRLEDRRAGLRTTAQGEAAHENFRLIARVVDHIDYEILATRGDRLSLARLTLRGGSPSGFEAETLQLHECDEQGLITLVMGFDLDDLEAAMRVLDERFATSGEAASFPTTWGPARAFIEHYNARDWNGLEGVLHPDFVLVDHLPAGFGTLDGPGFYEWARSLIAMAPDLRAHFAAVPVIRLNGLVGLVVNRGSAEGGGPFELTRAVSAEFEDGQLRRMEFFPADHLDRAQARLEEMTADSPGAGEPKPTAAGGAMQELIGLVLASDWERVRARIAPDVEWTDQRVAVGMHVTDAETYLENLRAIVGLGVTAMDATVLATRGEEHQLAHIVFRGETRDGDAGEVAILQVNGFDPDGRIRYSSDFEPADRTRALAHLDERFIASLPVEEADVVSIGTRFVSAYNERDWDEHFGLLSDDFASDDHRAAGQGRLDQDAFERLVLGLVEVAPDARIEVVEIREVSAAGFVGVTMLSGTGDVVGPSELLRAQLIRVRDGRITHLEHWAPEDIDAAVAALHEATAGPQADVLRVLDAFVDAIGAGDADRLGRIFAPACRVVDHRPVGWGDISRDEFLDLLRSLFELAPDFHARVTAMPRVSEQGVVFLLEGEGTDSPGGQIEIANCQVFLVADGVVIHQEVFPIDAVDAALARFDELIGRVEDRTSPADWPVIPPNAATRCVEQFNELFASRDWTAMTELASEDYFIEDRRPGTQNTVRGRETFMENNRQMTAVTERVTTFVATRGERLALVRSVWRGELSGRGPFELETLDLHETDDRGVTTGCVVFDPADLDEALAELDARFLAAASPAAQAALRTGNALIAALEARDWAAFEGLLSPDLEVIDHRGIGFERRTRVDYLASARALLDLAPDMRSRGLCQPRATADGAVALWQFSGTYGDGTPFERPFVILSLMRDGVVHHMETFAAEDLDAAVARFDELTAERSEPSTDAGWKVGANRAWTVSEQVIESWLDRDWERHAALYSRDAAWEDRRPGLQASLRGRYQITGLSKVTSGVTATTRTLVATRGEHLSLGHAVLVGDDPARGTFEVETLQVLEIDDGDEVITIVQVDPSDIEMAHEELDQRFADGEAAAFPRVWAEMRRVVRSYNSGDRAFFAAQANGVTSVVDHRLLGQGAITGDRFRATSRYGDGSDARMTCLAVPRIRFNGIVAVLRTAGTVPLGGGDWEHVFVVVGSMVDGRTDHLEFFDPERLDAAIARFEELTA